MTVTLQDVAKLAGVSVGTASQALNQHERVTKLTRRRVEEAAQQLGYVIKDRRKPAMREPALNVIGVLSKRDVADISLTNPFYSHIYAGIEEACRMSGISLMFSHIEVDRQNRPISWPALVSNQLVDGLLFVGAQIEATAAAVVQRLNVPTVLIDSHAPQLPFDTVIIDNRLGTEQALGHLLALGHRQIGLIGAKQQAVPSIAERRDHYVKLLSERGLFNREFIEYSELYREEGYHATARLLERCPTITALFCCNDDTAAGALAAARERGLHVPRDVSIVGFDNIALAAELTPPLTTVHVHKNWLGIFGVRSLIERAQHPEKPKMTTLVATDMVLRASTAPPRSAPEP